MELKTPLYERHVALGGKIVPFGGYLLPVQYSGVIAEHMAVREKAGLFDVSHMGEVVFEGPDALANIQRLLTNDFGSLAIGRVRYSPMCNEKGGIVDDLIVYRCGEERYVIVVNASNRQKDVEHMKRYLSGDVSFTDISDETAQIALQGPLAEQILLTLTDETPQKYYSFIEDRIVAGIRCVISRTGYTGEDGFELYTGKENAEALWDALLGAGEPFGLIPCGLGARDTLRLEAAMPLYGHEMSDDITPLDTGLARYVKLDKGDFVGRDALCGYVPVKKRIGITVIDRGIAREHCALYENEKEIGFTTSGTHCPYLGCACAMAIVDIGAGSCFTVDVRGKRLAARETPLPFYKRK